MAYNFYKNITTVNRTVTNSRTIKYIVIHYTGNDTDTARANSNYFKSTNRGASAHYFVDQTDIYQVVEDKDAAWAVGKNYGSNNLFGIVTNQNSISIEMCSTGGKIADATFNNTVELTKELMKKYNISKDCVYRHFDVAGKSCPGWTGWLGSNPVLWDNFKAALSSSTPAPQPTPAPSTPTPTPTSDPKKELIKRGQQEANKFANCGLTVDGIVGKNTIKAKAKVLQHAMNLDYKAKLTEDGIFGTNSKKALGSHYVKKGEKQYMVTAAEILMYLNGLDPKGVEKPGIYGNGLVNAAKIKFGGDGQKISASNFLTLIQ